MLSVRLKMPLMGFVSRTGVRLAHASSAVYVNDLSKWRSQAIKAGDSWGEGVTVLRDRPDSATVRVAFPDRSSVIMKYWNRRGWRGRFRQVSLTTPSWLEWRAMTRLWICGVAVPRPVARFSVRAEMGRFNDVLVMEDLGAVRTVQACIKEALAEGRLDVVSKLEDRVVALTAAVVRAGVLDPDHSFMNIVCAAEGRLCRLDFELARRVPVAGLRPMLYARMIARLVSSFVFTVQPDGERASRFGIRIAEELRPSRRVLRSAKREIDEMLELQRERKGIDSRLIVDW